MNWVPVENLTIEQTAHGPMLKTTLNKETTYQVSYKVTEFFKFFQQNQLKPKTKVL